MKVVYLAPLEFLEIGDRDVCRLSNGLQRQTADGGRPELSPSGLPMFPPQVTTLL